MTAPVLPADTNPWAQPSRTRREATRMELSRLERTARAALSSMVTCSLAWTISMGSDAVVVVLVQFPADHVFAAHQNDLYSQASGGPNRAFHFGFGA